MIATKEWSLKRNISYNIFNFVCYKHKLNQLKNFQNKATANFTYTT